MLLTFTAQGQTGIIASDIKRSVNPCADFYEYANGAWRDANPIPPSMQRWSRRWASGELAKDQIKTIVEPLAAKTDWPQGSVDQLTGDYYGACMNEARINQLGYQPIQPWLADIDGMKNSADVFAMIVRFHKYGIQAPFNLAAGSDTRDPNQVIVDIAASGLDMPDRDYYLNPEARFKEAREKYRVHVAASFRLIGYSQPEAERAADQVFAMESKLAEASLDNVALRDPHNTDHKLAFADLQKLTPHFDWAVYYGSANLKPATLNVQEPKFLQEVDRRLASAPLEDWKSYLKFHLVESAANSLSQPFVEETFNFHGRYLGGQAEMKPRWKRCIEAEDNDLGEALGQKYVEKYFPPEAKARMLEMVKNLRLAMQDTIEGLEWMGPDTKKKALEKLATFNPKIGYPDKWKDYSSVKIERDFYWSDVLESRKFNVADDLATIGRPVDRGRWGMTPSTSDAYYNPPLNEIVFPAGILQPPGFDVKAVDAVNYGGIGVVIGHEISHGFDDEGSQYDAQGRLQNWWTAEDRKRFDVRTQCVVDQFDHYFIEPGIHHNGKLVLGESIGDLAGAKIAFLAFQKSLQGKPPAPVIDGFTPEQQFFLAWGQWRGDEIRPEAQRLMVQTDPHPIAKYRVIGPLSNLPEFQRAFSCKATDAMVRPAAKRCQVW
ncbi:MAG: M13 family metallopeptidase [Acidobacteria bacterium]|nr:M13 family metallopeptidase [Acidobacteriota bacterium]